MRYALVVLTFGFAVACGSRNTDSVRDQNLSTPPPFPASPVVPEEPSTDKPVPPQVLPPGEKPAAPQEQPLPLKLYNPGKVGPFPVRSYSDNLQNPAYQSAIIFYPDDRSQRRFPATTLSGGYTNTKEYMVWLGKHLASHGIITIVFTPTNTMSVDANIWATGHLGSLGQLESENQRNGSPIAGRLNVDRLGVMGFSMGGAGTVLAVNKAGSRVKAAVPLCPYRPAVLKAAVPMLSITGTQDTVAASVYVERAFTAAKTGQPKAFARFNGMSHPDVVFGGSHHEEIARYAISRYKVFLADELAYKTYLHGEELEKHREGSSVFARPQDYIFQEN
ncbi:MAG TPA: hypothetical protein VE954_21265 [Oligoflexus sp.]|uniref:alpha/beta hydrolase family protein n=1 Tax=Oligoflexus sp. TaxID=1971216 RepID=UPI002D2D669E|nr:hypothetical protein [Oligoflexus sp.]HYX35635.1 hypothetical protein [Oligoflexus sp.]